MEFIELPEFAVKVSRCGCVVSTITSKKLNHSSDRYGYPRIYTIQANGKRRGFFVHRLLAAAFIPNPEGKPFVNHINGKKSDFSLSNLEWCTHKENMSHAKNTGLWNRNMNRGTLEGRDQVILNLVKLEVDKKKIREAFQIEEMALNAIIRKETQRQFNKEGAN